MECRETATKPPIGRRMKGQAPPPPQAPEPAPRRIFRNAVPDGGGLGGVETKENLLRPTVDIYLTLPDGHQTVSTEEGSKALMDLLVELCSRYQLNPALHTLELMSPEGQTLTFKPNAPLGSLDVACVHIKEKVWEDRVVRRPAPRVPEKTVRLVVNFHRSQKAVVRVNPLVALQGLVHVICDKCEFDPAHVLLLKDAVSRHELPLDKSLTQLGIKELYVQDQSLVLQPKMASAPALNYSDSIRSSSTNVSGAEKKGILGIFKFNRRKSKTEETSMEMDGTDDKIAQNTESHSNGLSTVSAVSCVEARPSTLGQSQSVMNISRMSPRSEHKKRKAPPPPPGAPTPTLGHYSYEAYQVGVGSESQQRKRKAPAPPPTSASTSPGLDDTPASASPGLNATPASASPGLDATPASASPCLDATSASPSPGLDATPTSATPTPATRTKLPPPPSSSSSSSTSSTTTTTVVPTGPGGSTSDSLVVQDSGSELGHSVDDDSDPTGSFRSSSSSSCISSAVGGSHRSLTQPTATSSALSSMVEGSERTSQSEAAATSASETESALNLKLEEAESNRHSAIVYCCGPVRLRAKCS